ncbi:MAG: hypothetical protein K2J16_02575 [Clostridia bacterium]|nr:hypothetical protein [Clostridia bacterium]
MAKFRDIVKKVPFFGKAKTKSGNKAKLGTTITDSDGVTTTLLNPSGKAAKYSAELKNNQRYTNYGAVKKDKNGQAQRLTRKQRAYRAGYLQARKDSAKAYNANNGKGNNSASAF